MKPEEVAGYVGKRGSGKSTRAKARLSAIIKARQRCVVFDYHDEYSKQGRSTKQVRLGPLRDRVLIDSLLEAPELLDEEDLQLAVVPNGSPRACAEDFAHFAELVRSTGRVVCVVEEVGVFGHYAEDSLNELACQSRHDEVPLVFVSQRAVQVPKTARTQFTYLNSGRQDDPADLRALSEIAGEAYAAKVSRLGRGECVEWRDDFSKPPNPKEQST